MAACTFCGSESRSVTALMAGPGVYICADCVSFARSVIGEADSIAPPGGSSTVDLRCSFCDRSAAQVRRLIAGPKVQICDQCVGVAEFALSERA